MTASDLSVLAGQVLIAGFQGPVVPAELLERCARGALGGAILFRRNLGTVHEVRALTESLQRSRAAGPALIVAVDQEGGRVSRLGAPVVRLPAMARLSRLDDPALTQRAGELLGRQLGALGINFDLAPVLDVDTNPQNPVIGDRSFGNTPAQVIRHAGAFARGLRAAGVLSCGKHFPGHGDTDLDSHLALPRLSHDLARLRAVELAPFEALCAELDAIMTAHIVFDALDPGRPATLSARVIEGLLRAELGFNGVVVSDDLEMQAIAATLGPEEAAVRAIAAGIDLLLICSRLDWLERAATALSERAARDSQFAARLRQAAERVMRLRATIQAPPSAPPLDLRESEAAALSEEIEARLAQQGA